MTNEKTLSQQGDVIHHRVLPEKIRTIVFIILGAALLIALFFVSRYNYLLFHSIAELFSIAVAWSVFLLVWNVRLYMKNNALIFLGISYLFIGFLDLLHTLSYEGMGIFQITNSSNLATQFWISARGLEALSLLCFSVFLGHRLKLHLLFWIYIGITVFLMGSMLVWGIFPVCYVEDVGLTPFKIGSEYAISLMLLIAIFYLRKKKDQLDLKVYHLLVAAMALTIAAEIAFTFYTSVYGLSNLIGHYFKIISFFLIYLALVHSGLIRPYGTLFKELSQEKEALRASEEKYRITFNSIGDAIIVTDTNGNISRMNSMAQTLTGWNLEEAQDRQLAEIFNIFNAHTRKPCNNPLQKVIQTGEIQGLANDTCLLSKDGTEYQISDSCAPILDANKCIAGVVLTFRDVTEAYRMQEALRKSEHRHRLLFENAVNGVALHEILLDEHGTPIDYVFLEVNSGFERQTGLKAGEVVGRRVTEVLPGIEQGPFINIYGKVVMTGEPVSFEQFVETLQRHYYINAYKIADLQFATTFQDITAQKEAEKALRAAKAEAEAASHHKSDFLAKMSHEIRTPMNSILGMLRLALLNELPDKQWERLHVAKSSAESLLKLLNELLDLSSIEAGKLIMHEKGFRPHQLLENVIQEMQFLAEEKGLSLSLNIDDNLPANLVGDSFRLKQVLINLLSNAVKYTEQGWITLEAKVAQLIPQRKENSHASYEILFTVQDTGRGIDPNILPKIFDSYEQATPYFISNKQGAGLGLSICKKLVEHMGGSIWVSSEPGKGSTFFSQIPFKVDDQPEEAKSFEFPSNSPESLPPLQVLLVEDQKMNQIFTVDLLSSQGHTVQVAENGQQALEKLYRNSYDLVLMDIKMPVMDGLETAMRIRTADPVFLNPDIPIIGLSAHAAQEDEMISFQNSGFNNYLVKPINLKQLFTVMKKVLYTKN